MDIMLEVGGKDFHPRRFWISLSIIVMIFAWILYLQQPPQMTLFILPLHYFGIWLFSRQISHYSPTTHASIGFMLYFMNVLLDIFLYNPIHALNISPIYYISINFIHVLWYFAIAKDSSIETRIMQLSCFIMAFTLWITYDYFNSLWMLCLPIAIFSIIKLYFDLNYKIAITSALIITAILFIFIPLIFNTPFYQARFFSGDSASNIFSDFFQILISILLFKAGMEIGGVFGWILIVLAIMGIISVVTKH
jgi:hypothetical protein